MKKIFATLILLSLVGLLTVPLVADAGVTGAAPDQCVLRHGISIGSDPADTIARGVSVGDPASTATTKRDDWGLFCVMDTVYTVIDWIFWIVLAVSGIIILFGALQFATAAGDPEKTGRAKKFLVGALLGIIVAVFARAIPSIVLAILLK